MANLQSIDKRLKALETRTGDGLPTVTKIQLVGVNPDGTKTPPVTIWEAPGKTREVE